MSESVGPHAALDPRKSEMYPERVAERAKAPQISRKLLIFI